MSELKDLKDNFTGNFTAFSYSSNMLLLGSDLGEILQMELPSKTTKYFDLEGAILSIDSNFDDSYWAAGSDLGILFIKKTNSRFAKKTYNDFGEGKEIRQIRFYKENALVVSTLEKVEIVFLRDLKLGLDCTRVAVVKNS